MVIAAFQSGRGKCAETSAATPKKLLPYLRPLDLPRVELSVSSCHAIITLAQLLAHTHTHTHERAYDQTILPIKLFLLISKLILLFLFGRMIQTSAPPTVRSVSSLFLTLWSTLEFWNRLQIVQCQGQLLSPRRIPIISGIIDNHGL